MSHPEESLELRRRARILRACPRLAVGILLAWTATTARAEPQAFRDTSVDLSQSRTFAVVLGTPWGNPECERRTLGAVETRVTQRGWSKASDDSADLLVVVHGRIAERTGIHRYPSPRSPKGGFRHRPDRTHAYSYRERTMTVELRERVSGRVAWRAEAPGVVASDFEREHARIEKKLNRLLATFPRRSPLP